MPELLVKSFAPIADKNARVLILGSMPGVKSLEENQYYGHPRNLFWPMLAALSVTKADVSYQQRTKDLKENSIALWDVLAACERKGSLDSDIKNEVPNDLDGFLKDHPKITHIFFNGGKAQSSFKRHFPHLMKTYNCTLLPSTSPANAGTPYDAKLAQWQQILLK